jgi:transcriptional regulator with XRE-family HTH domain
MSETTATGTAPIKQRVASEVRANMARQRISGSEMARRIGVSQPYLHRRISGEIPFDIDDLARVAEVLNVRIADLLPRDQREVTVSYVPPSVITASRNPMKGFGPPIKGPGQPERTGRTGRTTMVDPAISQAAQRVSARAARELQPCS